MGVLFGNTLLFVRDRTWVCEAEEIILIRCMAERCSVIG